MFIDGPHIPVAHIARCQTHVCWRRVHARRVRAFLWRRIRSHPMPWCTWGPESSGPPYTIPAYSSKRYSARNPSSSAGGKFQIIDSTWITSGGTPYRSSHPAAVAPPLEQERVARVVLHNGGLGQWANC